MEKPTEQNKGFRQLLNGLLDGQLTAGQVRQLERTIQANPEAMKLYVDTVTLSVGLRKYSQTQRGAMKEALGQQKPDESALWQTLATDEKQAPTIKFAKKRKWLRWTPKTVLIRPKEQNIEHVRRHISRIPIVTLIVSTAALVFLLLYIQLLPAMHVAKLNDSVHAVWDNRANQFREGIGLHPVNTLQTLKEGFAQVRFASGALVVFESPCQFMLENKNQFFLKQGKVFVTVPKEAFGFTVRTPNGRIVDLGTEFGVTVDPEGSCWFHMFSGMASVVADAEGQEKFRELLLAGQACVVEAAADTISVASFQKDQYVQRINSNSNTIWRGEKSISLADMVVGGNGLGMEPKGCLDPFTGAIEPQVKGLSEDIRKNHPQLYNTLSTNLFVNGLFVPNGTTKVSSMNHRFEFPKTSDLLHYPVWVDNYYVTDQNEGSQFPRRAAVSKQAFYLHANLGITFDLDAIRKAYPDTKITGFRTLYGIRWGDKVRTSKVSFWMLVDGKIKHPDEEKQACEKLIDAYIPLSDTDRFLTLATTDADLDISEDWGVFVNPVIELTTSNTSN